MVNDVLQFIECRSIDSVLLFLQGKPYENVLMHLGGSIGVDEEEEVEVEGEVDDGGDGGEEDDGGDGEQQLVVHKVIV